MKRVEDQVKPDPTFVNGRVEIDPARIKFYVKGLVSSNGSKEPEIINFESLQEAVRPVIDFYSSKAGRGQKIEKEVRRAAISYLKSQGFEKKGFWNGQGKGPYLIRVEQQTNQNT